MVRLLLLSLFFLANAAFAHNANAIHPCETFINPPQQRTYQFLKKLQVEADQDALPESSFTRVIIGRSLGPLAAAMRQAGSQINSVPLELNFQEILKGEEKVRLWQLFDTYMPGLREIGHKPLAIMVYAENAKTALALYHMVREYMGELGKPAGWIDIRIYTTQVHVRELTANLVKGYDGLPGIIADKRNVRPIAAANEVLHWFHDGLKPNRFDHSEYAVINVRDPEVQVPSQKGPVGELFADLVLRLGLPGF